MRVRARWLAAGIMAFATTWARAADPSPCLSGEGDEATCIPFTGGLAKRSGNLLTLRLDNGKARKLRDTPKDCEAGTYEKCLMHVLRGYRPVEGLYVVDMTYTEGGSVEVIARADGRSVTVYNGKPDFSPSGKLFVGVESSEAYGQPDRDIGIWSTGQGLPQLVWSHAPSEEYAMYDFVAWEGEDRIVLKVTDNPGNGSLREGKATITHRDGAWTLEHDSGPVPAKPAEPEPYLWPLMPYRRF